MSSWSLHTACSHEESPRWVRSNLDRPRKGDGKPGCAGRGRCARIIIAVVMPGMEDADSEAARFSQDQVGWGVFGLGRRWQGIMEVIQHYGKVRQKSQLIFTWASLVAETITHDNELLSGFLTLMELATVWNDAELRRGDDRKRCTDRQLQRCRLRRANHATEMSEYCLRAHLPSISRSTVHHLHGDRSRRLGDALYLRSGPLLSSLGSKPPISPPSIPLPQTSVRCCRLPSQPAPSP